MFAVIRTGGKQYKVAKDDVIVVEKVSGDAGAPVEAGEVLMVSDGRNTSVGNPVVEGANVSATIVEQTRGDKITVFKKKRRKGYRRMAGHRQPLTVLRIGGIAAPGIKEPATAAGTAKPAAKAQPETQAKKPAPKKAAGARGSAAAPKKSAEGPGTAKAKPSTKEESGNGA